MNADANTAAREMHQAIDDALPTLRSLVVELRSDGQDLRATALEEATSSLASSRRYIPAPTEMQLEEFKDAAPKPHVDLHD